MKMHSILLSSALLCLASATARAGNFVVDKSQSELAADMHASPSHNFTTVAKDYACDIEIDPDSLRITKATCRFEFEALDSGKDSRDKKMRKWMNIERYPEASYTMEKLTATGKPGSYLAEGVFTMHGTSLPLNIQVRLERTGDEITLTGESELDHREWGLEKVRLLFFSVDPLLKPRFRLVGQLKESTEDV